MTSKAIMATVLGFQTISFLWATAPSACDSMDLVESSFKKSDHSDHATPGGHQVTILTQRLDGTPTPARLHVTDGSGQRFPNQADAVLMTHRDPSWMDEFFYTDGSVILNMPAGSTQILAGKGFEYTPKLTVVNVQSDTTILVQLEPEFDMRATGWFGGDVHMHSRHDGAAGYLLSPEQAQVVSQAEDIAMSWYLDNSWEFTGGIHALSTPEHLLYFTTEHRNQIYGHAPLLGLDRTVSTGSCEAGRPASPTLSALYESWNFGYGQAMVLGHPRTNADFFDDAGWPAWGLGRGLPLLAAYGYLDAYDIASWSNFEDVVLEDWYRLLNCGKQIPPSAGTDAAADRYWARSVGGFRVYVQTGQTMLTSGEWVEQLKGGECFVSNFPLIPEFSVNGVSAGGVVHITEGEEVEIRTRVQSVVETQSITILQGGDTVETAITLGGAPVDQELVRSIPVTGSTWFAIRVTGISDTEFSAGGDIFAHTGAVFVVVDEIPLRDTEAAGYFMDWTDDLEAFAEIRGNWANESQRLEVLGRIDFARDHFGEYFVDAPADFELLDPSADSTLTREDYEFVWQSALDVEVADAVRYSFEVRQDTTLLAEIFLWTDADTSVTVTLDGVIPSGEHFWRVRAYDRGDNVTTNFGGWRRFEFELDPAGVETSYDPSEIAEAWFRAEPNPVHEGTWIRWRGPHSGESIASVFDVAGREVRRHKWPIGSDISPTLEWYWDGKDHGGRTVPSGTYWVRYRGGYNTAVRTARVVVAR